MQTARLTVLLILTSFGAAFAQSTVPDKATQHHEKPSATKPDSKSSKDAEKAAKKRDKEAAKLAAKKADNAQNQASAQAYRTTVPKP